MDWSAGLPGAIWRAVTAPGDVYAGQLDPLSAEGRARAFDLASMLPSGGLLPRTLPARAAEEVFASRSAGLYNPPVKPPRPFGADYPAGAPADATGRLLQDIEGRPLAAEHVVGRRMVGGHDVPLTPAEVAEVAKAGTGSYPQTGAAREIGRDAGRVFVDRRSGRPTEVLINQGLTPIQAERALSHETGHVVDLLADRIPTDGLKTELKQVYNTLNTGWERTRHLIGPEHQGYKPADVPRELMAEAIRAYMTDPNYLKTVAPRTAAAIREAVNADPRLSRTIQFNTGGLPAGVLSLEPERYDDRAFFARP